MGKSEGTIVVFSRCCVDSDLIYLDHAATSQRPECVIEAEMEF